MSIQGFISDRSLIDSTRSLVNLETLAIPLGYLDRDTIEFFVEPLAVSDLREDRLGITYRQEEIGIVSDIQILTDTLGNIVQVGIVHLTANPTETVTLAQYPDLDVSEFDTDVMLEGAVAISNTREMGITIDSVKLSTEEAAALNAITVLEQQRLFNLVEYLSYGTVINDSISDINVFLTGQAAFTGYVPNTVRFSSSRTIALIYGGLNIHRSVPQYVSFNFVIGSTQVTIKLWIDRNAFRTEYPISTIINLVPPLELATLLDPSTLADPISSAILSKAKTDSIITPELVNRDQTGMYLFPTRYVYNSSTYQVVFGLIYRGREPDSMEARNYIAEYLLNSGIGTLALWEVLLPDIFYHSSFVLIPFYDNITVLTNADIYPSIINATGLLDIINDITSLLPRATDTYREYMTAAYDKFLIGVAPADINESSSLLALHPTYRDFSTTDVGFSEMTASDREWAIKLNQALSVATGETNLSTVSIVESGGLQWVNFVYNYSSYLIITKASYLTHIASLGD